MLSYATPLLDEESQPRGAVNVLVDITDRKQAEESLRASEERFRSLFECSLEAIVVADDSGHYLLANEAACDLFGYPCDFDHRAGAANRNPGHVCFG